jgi:hypothetical protein
MLGGGILIAAVFAFLIYRIVTRIILPELKFRDDAGGDSSYGDCPALPDDLKVSHAASLNRGGQHDHA